MRETKEMFGILGWLRAGMYLNAKNASMSKNERPICKERVLPKRNWEVKEVLPEK